MNCLLVTAFWVMYLAKCQAKPSETTLKMPDSCLGEDFCAVKHALYPEDDIKIMLEDRIVNGGETTHITNRQGDNDANESVCKATTSYEKIYEIIDEYGRVRFVVQAEKLMTQIVRIEQCVNPGRMRSSNIFTENDLSTFKVTCETKRIEYKFLALTLDHQGFEMVKVKSGLPVCCSCRIYNPDENSY